MHGHGRHQCIPDPVQDEGRGGAGRQVDSTSHPWRLCCHVNGSAGSRGIVPRREPDTNRLGRAWVVSLF